jgi:F-type H+-transporting ATPase subunit a
MSNIIFNFINIYAASPLDQFGSDADFSGVLDNFITDFIPAATILDEFISFSGVSEVDGIADWVAIALATSGTLIFDDEDSSESEWEEGNAAISGLQATIFSANLLGMIPGLETTTSEASFTFLLSIATMITIILIGFALHNIRYMSILYPTGTPTIMAPFIILIEFISYIARAVSLGMRLFANMFAGHSLVKILMSFAWLFLTSALPVISIPVFILLLAIFMLECGIAYLQSYVFATLSGMYLEDVILLGH